MASKRVQDFVARNLGKSVEVCLVTNVTWKGILYVTDDGRYSIKTGTRGRPPKFTEDFIKTIRHYKPEEMETVAPVKATRKATKKATVPNRKAKAKDKVTLIPTEAAPDLDEMRDFDELSDAEKAKVEALADALVAESQ